MIQKSIFLVVLVLALACNAFAADYVLVTLLHTNDMHGNVIADSSGLAKAATLVRQIRAEMPNVLLLDAGDIIHGSYEDYLSNGRATISAMNAAAYAAATTGNHEYDFGPDVVRTATSTATFPMLAANVKDRATGGAYGKILPYYIANISGVRIAVLGLTTQETMTLNWPSTVSEIRVDDPIDIAKLLVPELKKQADVIVVLSHLGYELDRKLAADVPGIDFIIGGHSHTTLSNWEWVGDTLITQAGSKAEYLGRIDFIASVDETGAKIVSVNGKGGILWDTLERKPLDKTYPKGPLIKVTADLPDDDAVVTAYKPYRQAAEAILSETIGESDAPITMTATKSGETEVGDFVADAVRAKDESDIALVDSSSVVFGLPAGTIKLKDAFDMIGGWTRQQIIIVRIKGCDLAGVLSDNLVRNKILHYQVSGTSLSYKLNKSGCAEVCSMFVGGLPIDKDKDYTIAGQAYVIQQLMQSNSSVTVASEPGGTVREAIALYIRTSKKITPPTTGRISIQK